MNGREGIVLERDGVAAAAATGCSVSLRGRKQEEKERSEEEGDAVLEAAQVILPREVGGGSLRSEARWRRRPRRRAGRRRRGSRERGLAVGTPPAATSRSSGSTRPDR